MAAVSSSQLVTAPSSQMPLRIATYKRYDELSQRALKDAVDALKKPQSEQDVSEEQEKAEAIQKYGPDLREIGRMLSEWQTKDHLDLALIEIFTKHQDPTHWSAEMMREIEVVPLIFKACALRDGQADIAKKWSI